MITKDQKEDIEHLINCVEAQARTAAEQPAPFNLMALGGSLQCLRQYVRDLYSGEAN
ncbi:TPA: hypothetical protein LTY94_004592 [Salmonella enterica subsp. enterica serovar Typhimurium]|nr:hypothetical protein [Salmonella enterica subsp. enterica serovar Typhimurium]HBL5549844.1 hypothetical protein [Salmonella enterica subsp. enterica serovar Typhimurium]HBL5554748.1 hypothetical protein [Salmonella enterica subsp. enterica serovar Typhimurium]HBL5877435.1 hypothetical protein [Salmonella enterica subsp. enterica serovar Typhimurium]HBL9433919.1 hypothetical protein [Salmonella enterica subsp. enterica serovar Typhimurium]